MQFPVPQFTEVEDKIIGPLTMKQFGIVFGAGVIIFLAYSATKSLPVLVVFAILFGLPALGVAFAKPNGRPMYDSFGYMLRFVMSPKELLFHKEINWRVNSDNIQEINLKKSVEATQVANPTDRLKELNAILQKKAAEEKELIGRIEQN